MATVVADLNPKTLDNAKRQFVELYGAPLLLNRYLKIALGADGPVRRRRCSC